MNIINELFGHGSDLTILQICFRAALIFFVALLLIRVSGMRSFSNKSAFDIIITIMLGAILSRAVVGANPFVPTCLAGLTLSIIHRSLGYFSVHHDILGKIIKGNSVCLYDDSGFNFKHMLSTGISKKDIMEEVHQQMHKEVLDEILKIYMERSGKISIIKK